MTFRFPNHFLVSSVLILTLSGPLSMADEPNYLPGELDLPTAKTPRLPERLPLVNQDRDTTSFPDNKDAGSHETEVIIERFADRKVRVKREVTQDANFNYVNHGSWTLWDKNGTKVAEGSYRLGQRHGTWTRWHTASEFKSMKISADTGFVAPILSTANFVDDEVDGLWTLTDADDRKIASREFDHGQLHGKNVVWYSNGTKQFEVTYDQGVLGVLRQWNATSKLAQKREFTNGREFVLHREKYKDGSVKVEGPLLKAKQILQTDVDWWNGIVKTEIVDAVGSDERNGTWIFHFPNGEKQLEMRYKDNEPTGRIAGWFANGQQSVVGYYNDGKQHGEWTWWHENGQKQIEGKFEQGAQLGNWIQWNEGGKVVYVEFHSHPEQRDVLDSGEMLADSPSLSPTKTVSDDDTDANSDDADWSVDREANAEVNPLPLR